MASRVPDSCEICHSKDKPAKVLPCLHILCDDCIEELQVRDPKVKEIACPVDRCGKTLKKDSWRPDAYPVSYHRQLAQLKESVEQKRVTCDPCFQKRIDKLKATSICDECGFLCKNCDKVHKKNPNYSDHRIISLTELSQSQDDTPYHQEVKRKRALSFDPEQLRVHSTEHSHKFRNSFSTYNFRELEQKKLILQVAQEEARKRKDEIKKRLPDIRAGRGKLKDAADEVKTATDKVKDQHKALATLIDNKCDQLKRKISQTQSDLHKSLDYLTHTKLRPLQSQQAKLEGMVKELQRLTDYTESTLETSTATELLSNSRFLQDRINDASRDISQAQTEPVELPNMAIKDSVTADIQKICQKQLRIYTKDADPRNCSVEGLSTLKVEAFQEARFMLNVVDKVNKPCSNPQNVTIKVICSHNYHSFSAQVSEARLGKIQVLFKPEFSGDHCIHVDVNEESIKGSPFSIKVQMSSSELERSSIQETVIISGIEAPRAVALTDDGSLLVCEMHTEGGRIIKLDKHHRRVGKYGCDESKLYQPTGISLDASGNMYVVDGLVDPCRLVKFDANGEMLKSVDKKELKCTAVEFRGVQVNKQNSLVYVGDHGNHCIQIFNCDLKHLRSIELGGVYKTMKNPSKPSDIVFDDEGNMYVTDYANHCILVFNRKEQFTAQYATRDHVTGGGPDSISIDDAGLIYVTVPQAHCVLVFRKSGEFVKRFGREGQGQGELKLPIGIVVNRKGSMVYVCDFFNKRIQLFY